MKNTQTLKVKITEDYGNKSTFGEIQIQSFSKKERTIRAFRVGGMCWGAALVAILIPLLHFILVPALLIAGPVAAFVISGQENIILGGNGICPHCQKDLPIGRSSSQFPIRELCTKCQSNLKISEKS